MPIHMQESYRPPNRQDQKDNSLCDVTVQTLSAQKKVNILKTAAEKAHI